MRVALVIDNAVENAYSRLGTSTAWRIEHACTGVDGLLRALSSDFAAVVCDMALKDVSALTVIRVLSAAKRYVPIAAMAADYSTSDIAGAITSGACDVVLKPLTSEGVARLLAVRPGASISLSGGSHDRVSTDPVDRALALIECAFRDHFLSLARAAETLGVSREHLCRALKRRTGHTFGSLVQQRRLREARHLLLSSPLSVKEVAARSGFGSTTQADRWFRRLLKRSPSAVRRSAEGTAGRGPSGHDPHQS